MGHRNARLTVYGRRLLVQRVRFEGMPVAHVAKAMGISRHCAHQSAECHQPNGRVQLDVVFGEVVLEDAVGGCPSERSVVSVVIVEVDEPFVGVGSLAV